MPAGAIGIPLHARIGGSAWAGRRRQGRVNAKTADCRVTTPKGFGDAFKQLVEGGWIGISAPTEFGGQGLPMILTQIVNEFLSSSNLAFAMYPGLTQGAIAALIAHGSPELKARYL